MNKILIPSHVVFRGRLLMWNDFVGQTIIEGELVMYMYDSDKVNILQREAFEAGRNNDFHLFEDYLKSLENGNIQD
jgi:hypothetical protein